MMSAVQPQITNRDVIIAINPGHDGTFVAIRDRQLQLFLAAEHDSQPRYLPANAYFLLRGLAKLETMPAVLAFSGWTPGWPYQSSQAPYHGIDESLIRIRRCNMLGHQIHIFESTHERSHIFAAYGMAPYKQGEPCYVLVWEGDIGRFYEIDRNLQVRAYPPVLRYPGFKYSFLYDLADRSRTFGTWRHDTAGKLMALAAFASGRPPGPMARSVIARILKDVVPPSVDKAPFAGSPYLNCGVTNQEFCDLVAAFSDEVFEIFCSFAKRHLTNRYPLLISGGCGLNCDWNSRWRASGLFPDVFVPPVPNDSGSAVGTAIEAQFACTGSAKINWSVYSGPEFEMNGGSDDFVECALNNEQVAALLDSGAVVAWIQGKSEIGPRALGNRSLLAAPFKKETRDRLNKIKGRESYRPIAPVCLEEDAGELFDVDGSSPFMLYFYRVRVAGLDAITHVDGSARPQTVTETANEALHALLTAFKQRSGFGVLCNTSLNRKGCGFFNKSRDVFEYAREHQIEAVVINSSAYITPNALSASPLQGMAIRTAS